MMCSATLSRINSIAGELRSASMNVAVLEFGHDQLVTVVACTMQWSYSPSIATKECATSWLMRIQDKDTSQCKA
jgi:hypothetical protein